MDKTKIYNQLPRNKTRVKSNSNNNKRNLNNNRVKLNPKHSNNKSQLSRKIMNQKIRKRDTERRTRIRTKVNLNDFDMNSYLIKI